MNGVCCLIFKHANMLISKVPAFGAFFLLGTCLATAIELDKLPKLDDTERSDARSNLDQKNNSIPDMPVIFPPKDWTDTLDDPLVDDEIAPVPQRRPRPEHFQKPPNIRLEENSNDSPKSGQPATERNDRPTTDGDSKGKLSPGTVKQTREVLNNDRLDRGSSGSGADRDGDPKKTLLPGNRRDKGDANDHPMQSVLGETTRRSAHSDNNLFSIARVLQKVKQSLGDINERYPPPQKMVKDGSNFVTRLTKSKKNTFNKIVNSLVKGVPAYNLSRLTENDAFRLLDDLEEIPLELERKLTTEQDLGNLSTTEANLIPASLLLTLTEEKLAEFNALPEDKLQILCNKLLVAGASPWNLRSVIEAGLNCMVSPEDLTPITKQERSKKKGLGCSLSKVMMTYVRESQAPESWDSNTFVAMATTLTEAITVDDILRVPKDVLRDSMKNLSTVGFPFKSQVRAIIDRASDVFNTPTSWPESFITDAGPLLEQVDIHKVALLRNDALYDLIEELEEAGIQNELTRLVLAGNIYTAYKTKARDTANAARVMPWLKGENEFFDSLSPHWIVEIFKSYDLSTILFSKEEKQTFATKIEHMLRAGHFGNDTDEYMLGLSVIIEGFTEPFLEWIPDNLAPNVTMNVPFEEVSKARLMIKKLKRYLKKERLSASESVMLFNGLNLTDIDDMTVGELEDSLPGLRTMDLPFHIGRKVVKKIERSLLRQNKTDCNMAFPSLGNLAVHVSPQVIEDEKYIPVPLHEDGPGVCPQSDFALKKSQAYAVMENVHELLMTTSTRHFLDAKMLRRLGRFVEGLSVKVIEALPLDTELLSIIEVMGESEDELTSAQTEAIVEKIRQYFDFKNRQKITEASDITIAQIGRLLQYLNADFELPKFPKELRPSISKEIGKSSLLKVSTGQRQALMLFALRNAEAGNRTTTDLMGASTIDNKHIQDLGSLKCGLNAEMISKLTPKAIDLNMEEFQKCPLKDDIFEALIKKAVDLDTNRLRIRHKLGKVGAGLQYLDDDDLGTLNKKEISAMTSYLTSSMHQLDSVFEKTEKNGFVLEQNTHTKGLRKERGRRFAKKLYSASKETQSFYDCSQLFFIGPVLPGVLETIGDDFYQCKDVLKTLHNLEQSDARTALEEIFFLKDLKLNTTTLSSIDTDTIAETSGLLKGLTDTEIKHLNLADINTLAVVGTHGFSRDQLQSGFEAWKSHQPTPEDVQVSEDDLTAMQDFACGMPASFIENNVAGPTVRNCLGGLGRRRCFKQGQLTALANKVTQAMTSTPVDQWKGHLIYEMGHVIGGLDKKSLQQLTRDQMGVIEPEVFTALPPEKVTELTVKQLEELSPNQAAAFTTMQRSFMSEEQMAAIGRDFLNGAGQNTVANCSVVVIFLSLLRQLVVYL